MSYLSRIPFHSRSRSAMRLVADPQSLHAAVAAATAADAGESDSGRPLWRLDRTAEGRILYIASPTVPALAALAEQAGAPGAAESRSLEPLFGRLQAGQRWAFRLTANPTHSEPRTNDGSGERGKVYGHVTAAQQLDWLSARAARLGVDFGGPEASEVQLTAREVLRFARRSATVTISTVQYDGILTIREPEPLVDAMRHGIGRAKAYGCGLLTLAPAR